MHVISETVHLRTDIGEEINSHAESIAKASLKILKVKRLNLALTRHNEQLRIALLESPKEDYEHITESITEIEPTRDIYLSATTLKLFATNKSAIVL